MVADKQTKEDMLASAILFSTIKFNGGWYEVGSLWNGEQTVFSNNFLPALGPFRGLKSRLVKNGLQKLTFIDTISPHLKKRNVSIL